MTRHRLRASRSLVFTRRMYWFLLPALILFSVFWVYPVLQLFFYSLTNYDGVIYNFDFVGLRNYQTLLKDGTLVNSLTNTLLYTLMVVVGGNLLGLFAALMLTSSVKAKGLFRTLNYLPALFSAMVVGFIWSYVFMPETGFIASLLNAVGIDSSMINILGNAKTALVGIAAVEIWRCFGTTTIIYIAGLQTVDVEVLEAAQVDGCTSWQMIRSVKLPMIAPTITINVILSVISGLKSFDNVFVLTNGGPGRATNTLMFSVYKIAFTDQMMGKASALAVVAFTVIVIVTLVMLVFLGRKEID